nr:MAG TPA: hypothetical protein [Caudoviricetes sp.]
MNTIYHIYVETFFFHVIHLLFSGVTCSLTFQNIYTRITYPVMGCSPF